MKYIIILIDIDGTLIDTDLTDDSYITWTGGSSKAWVRPMTELKAYASTSGINIHFGIATYRSIKYRHWEEETKIIDKGLEGLIDTDLVFFTNKECKNLFALIPAALKLKETIKFSSDIWLIDDRETIINKAKSAGFSVVHAENLTEGTAANQQQLISNLFQPIKKYIDLRSRNIASDINLKSFSPDVLGNALFDYIAKEEFDLIKSLLIKYPNKFTDYQLSRSLLFLIVKNKYDLAKLLLTQRPDTDKNGCYFENGNYALHLAVSVNEPDMRLIELLAKNNNHLNIENNEEQNSLLIAIKKAHYKISAFFLQNYADKFTPDQLGHALLSLVHRRQHVLAKLLLTKRPDAKKSWHYTKNRMYAPHLAVSVNHPDLELIKLLAKDNYYLNCENRNQENVLDIAHKKNHSVVANFFITTYGNKFGVFSDEKISMSEYHSDNDLHNSDEKRINLG